VTPRIKLFFLVVFVFTFSLAVSRPSLAAPVDGSAITMEVAPAYQGYFKYGEWLPIWVTLNNSGADLQAEIHVRVSGSYANSIYALPVSLPAGAHKILPVYVLPNNFSHELKVGLISAGETLLTENLTIRPLPNINYLIGIVARERGALSLLQGIRLPSNRTQILVDLTLDELPERISALNSLDCLVINDTDTSSLTPEQKSALLAWVQRGGRLVIGGGVGGMQTVAGLPHELLPVIPTAVTDLSKIVALEDFADSTSIRVPGPFVVATGEVKSGLTLASQDGIPLIQEKAIGSGFTSFVALDLNASPFDAWTGTTAFWETLITPGADYPSGMPPDMSPRQMMLNSINNALNNLPSLDLPSARWLAILLAVYIVLVGPVNYFLLRWRKALNLAWITIPAITLVFSGMSFGLGYAKRGTDIIINKVAIARAQPDSPAQVYSFIGLFSPANLSYEIEVEGDHLLSPATMDYYDPWAATLPEIQDVTYLQGNPGVVRGLTVNQWSMQSFVAETTWEIGTLTGELAIRDGALVGTVTNHTGYFLEDVVVVLQSDFARLGDLGDGDSVAVNLKIGDFEQQMFSGGISWRIFEPKNDPISGQTSRETEFKRMILEGILDQAFMYGEGFNPNSIQSAKDLDYVPEVTIFGWIDEAPPQLLVNGNVPQETASTLYLTQLPYVFPLDGKIKVPVGMIPGVVVEMPISGGFCGGSASTSVWFDRGETVMEFILPGELRNLELDKLQLFIKSDSSWITIPKIELYHWESQAWETLENVQSGYNNLPNPTSWISPEGLLRVRLTLENIGQGGGCYYTGLGLEGTRK
jgi:hypothetical protein